MAFSPAPDLQWSLAIDTFGPARGDYGFAVFNGKYHKQFLKAGLPFVFEGRHKSSGHLVVQRDCVFVTLDVLVERDDLYFYRVLSRGLLR